MKPRNKQILIMICTMLFIFAYTSIASAAITAYVSGNAENGYYEYSTQDILNSFIFDDNQILYKDYVNKGPVALFTTKYVSIQAAINAFVMEDIGIEAYANSASAQNFSINGTLYAATVGVDGKMSYQAKTGAVTAVVTKTENQPAPGYTLIEVVLVGTDHPENYTVSYGTTQFVFKANTGKFVATPLASDQLAQKSQAELPGLLAIQLSGGGDEFKVETIE